MNQDNGWVAPLLKNGGLCIVKGIFLDTAMLGSRTGIEKVKDSESKRIVKVK